MREATLRRLRCPRTGADLRLEHHRGAADGDVSDEVRFGVLIGPAGCYPVIDGIPIFVDHGEALVELVRAGALDRARIAAIARSLPPTRARHLATAVAVVRPGGRLEQGAYRLADRWEARDLHDLTTGDGVDDPLALLRYGHQDRRGGLVDAYDYFAYRYSMPRHLVALGVVHGNVDPGGAVLDLGCGAGHLTWSLGQQPGDLDVVGVDPAYFQLWVARHRLGVDAELVCADAARLPFANNTFDAVLASDVLSFVVHKRTVVGEAARVARPGALLAFTALKNAEADHAYAGLPLPAAGWRALADGLPHRLIPDDAVLANYLAGSSAPSDRPFTAADLAGARTYTLLSSPQGELPGPRRFAAWPHGYGELAINPLFDRAESVPGGTRYRRRFPSAFYLDDNREMAAYLPEVVTIPDHRPDPASAEGEALVASLALLGMPEAYRSWGLAT